MPEDLHWTADGKKLIFIDARPSVAREDGMDPGRNGIGGCWMGPPIYKQ